MTQLYAVRNDGLQYKELDLTTMDVVNNAPEDVRMADIIGFNRSNLAMKLWWKTPETKFTDLEDTPPCSTPDVSLWSGGSGSSLVLSPKAFRFLGDVLQPFGELLPVIVGDETFYIFNCLTLGEADENKTEHEYVDGMKFGLKHIEFNEDADNHVVFKSKVDGCTTLFCGERFKNAIEEFKLNGIIFDKNLVLVFE